MVDNFWTKDEQEQLRDWLVTNFQFRREKINDVSFFAKALTHISISREWNYEQLEFLGDRIIGLIISDYLFKRHGLLEVGDLHDSYVSFTEASIQAWYFTKLDLQFHLKLAKNTDFADKKKGDVFEAFIAAVYLQFGMNSARKIFNKIAFPLCEKIHSFSAVSKMEEEVWDKIGVKGGKKKKYQIVMEKNSDEMWVARFDFPSGKKYFSIAKKAPVAREHLISQIHPIIMSETTKKQKSRRRKPNGNNS